MRANKYNVSEFVFPLVSEVEAIAVDVARKGKNAEQVLQFSKENGLQSLPEIIDLIEKCHIGHFDLTAVGRLIGWLNLSKFSQIDIKQLFK